MSHRHVTVRLLGTEGVGKTSLLEVLSRFASRAGAGGAVPGGCRIAMKGVEINILEMHFSDLSPAAPEADLWYLVVAADEGAMDLDELLAGKNIRFGGVFFNKCDVFDYDDDLIDLVRIDTRRQFYGCGMPEDGYSVFAGSVLDAAHGQVEAGISALEELLKDIVIRL